MDLRNSRRWGGYPEHSHAHIRARERRTTTTCFQPDGTHARPRLSTVVQLSISSSVVLASATHEEPNSESLDPAVDGRLYQGRPVLRNAASFSSNTWMLVLKLVPALELSNANFCSGVIRVTASA